MKPNVLSFPLRETIVSGDGLGSLPFPQAAAEWLETRRPYLSQRTTVDYGNYIKTLTAFFSEMRLQDIRPGDIRAYQRTRLERAGASLINHECSVLQQMLKRIGKWDASFASNYQPLPLPKESPHRALTAEEEALLYKVGMSNPAWEVAYCCFVISICTSAGPGELRHLRLRDVEINADGAVFRVNAEGAKNDGRMRTLALLGSALRAMQHLLARAQRLGSTQPEHYLLPFMVKKGTYDPTRPAKTWRTAHEAMCATAGIRVMQYSFRHHAVTKLLENQNISEETVEAIAGHISHKMKRRYSHIRMAAKRAALATLSRIQDAPAPVVPVPERPSLTNADVVEMLKDLPPAVVAAKIKAGPCRLNTHPDTLKQLKASGVPDSVILAMVKAG